MFLSAIETVEEVGKTMGQLKRPTFDYDAQTPYSPPDYQKTYHPTPDHYGEAYGYGYDVYGPPWPPEQGPTVPVELRAELRAMRNRAHDQAVPRDGD